jgi:hypothetical protein
MQLAINESGAKAYIAYYVHVANSKSVTIRCCENNFRHFSCKKAIHDLFLHV